MKRPRIVIVGAGFAGYNAAKTLCRLARGRADIVVVKPTDYFLYVPLLPEVASGILEPRRLTVSIADSLPDVRLVLGEVDGLDLEHVPLAGFPAKVVTRGYHLLSMPGNRVRTATDWLYDAVLRRQTTQLGVIPAADVPLETASPERIRKH